MCPKKSKDANSVLFGQTNSGMMDSGVNIQHFSSAKVNVSSVRKQGVNWSSFKHFRSFAGATGLVDMLQNVGACIRASSWHTQYRQLPRVPRAGRDAAASPQKNEINDSNNLQPQLATFPLALS